MEHAHSWERRRAMSWTPRKLFFLSFVGLCLFVLGAGAQRDSCELCTDKQPPGPHSCKQQKIFGKCSSLWMSLGQYCNVSCGRCTPCKKTARGGNFECHCNDVEPPGPFTCAQQKQFGKCDMDWMVRFGYCDLSCGRCQKCKGKAGTPQAQDSHPFLAFDAVDDGTNSPDNSTDLQCDDVPPPGPFSCEQQKGLGKCKAVWMVDGGYCSRTCGRCRLDSVDLPPFGSEDCVCTDIQPAGGFSCQQQRDFGKCMADWMLPSPAIPEGYCQTTCGRCWCSGAPARPADTPPYTPVGECTCSDVAPPRSTLTCKQQREFGKCEADWMVDNSVLPEAYCQTTCGRCPCISDAEPVAPEPEAEEEDGVDSEDAPPPAPPAQPANESILPPQVEPPVSEPTGPSVPVPPAPTISLPTPPTEAPQAPEAGTPITPPPTPIGLPPPVPRPTLPELLPSPEPAMEPSGEEPGEDREEPGEEPREEPREESEEESREDPGEETGEATLAALPSSALLGAPETEGRSANRSVVSGGLEDCTPTLDVLNSRDDLSMITQLLKAGGLVDENDQIVFKGTLLAPTDDALERAISAFNVTFDELLANQELVPGLVAFHILTETLPSDDMTDGLELETRLGGTSPLTVKRSTVGGSTEISVVGPRSTVNLIETDIPSCDLLIHVIDGFLLPNIETEQDKPDIPGNSD